MWACESGKLRSDRWIYKHSYLIYPFDLILDRLENPPVYVLSKLGSCGRKVLGLVDEFGDEDEEIMREEAGKQLLAFHVNRYSQDDMPEFINLYLRSRNSNRALTRCPQDFINKILGYFQHISRTKF